MKYLLDVNALIALAFTEHTFHDRMVAWLNSARVSSLATCSIVELGFVRVLAQAPNYDFDVGTARSLLKQLKSNPILNFAFINDDHDACMLPEWVKVPKHTTNGHLAELAKAHGYLLATFDRSVPGAILIE